MRNSVLRPFPTRPRRASGNEAEPKGTPHGTRPPVAAIIIGATLLTALSFTPLLLAPAYVENYYLALLLTVLTLLPLAVRMTSKTFDVFEPIIPISLLIGLAFGIRAMYLAYAPVTMLPIRVGRFTFDDFVSSTLLLTIAAYCALLVGYYVVGGAVPLVPLSQRAARKAWSPTLHGGKFAVLLGAGALATFALRATSANEVSAATNVIGILAGLVQISGCILALHIGAGDQRRWLRAALWVVVVPMAVWQSVALAAKSPTLLMLYAVIAATHYAKRPIRLPRLAASVVLLVVVVFPVINTYRVPSDSPLSVSSMAPGASELASRAAAIPGMLAQMTPAEYLQLSAETLISRFSGVDAVSLLLKYDVSAELANPLLYLYVPVYAFIPRAVWPDKPVLEQGTRFGQLLIEPGTTQGVAWESAFGMFHIGDLLVNFGVTGVLIGMCVLGCLYRVAYRFFDPRNTPDLGVKFVYILLLWFMVSGFESDIPSIYSNLLKTLAIWTLIKIWLNPTAGRHTVRQSWTGPRVWTPRPSVLRRGGLRSGEVR